MNLIEEVVEENQYIDIGGHTIQGTRQYQQDCGYYYSDASRIFAVICDGMGGLNGGERASQEAVRLLVSDYKKKEISESFPAFFEREAQRMDERVSSLRDANGNLLNAGTTVVAISIVGNQLYWLSVGDSKIYIIRDKEIQAVVKEHNYNTLLNQQLADGKITRQKYDYEVNNGKAEALTSYLGIGGLKLWETNQTAFTLAERDIVLLCSDGLYKSLDEFQIQALARDNDIEMNIAARRLADMALQMATGGQDNTTVIMASYQTQ